MKNGPKGKTPSLIGLSNGKPVRVCVSRKSECSRCKCGIAAGEDCFGIPKSGNGFSKIKRYCNTCFDNILNKTAQDLEEIRKL